MKMARSSVTMVKCSDTGIVRLHYIFIVGVV